MEERVLVTGALGQIGSELVLKLQQIYGKENIIATDIKPASTIDAIYEVLDVLDSDRMKELVDKYNVTTVYHLAAMLSATAEKYPTKGWELNTSSLIAFLELAKQGLIKKLFWPSSIAVFGRGSQTVALQDDLKNPQTLYGIAKLAGEGWCEYYHKKYGVDVRSIRYPGLISWKTKPGGGTTDYAVEIFYDAIEKGTYTCPIEPTTKLPMLYMDDAINGTIVLMQAKRENLSVDTAYNIGGLSFSPDELTVEIQKKFPAFEIQYELDNRAEIAKTWPESVEDSVAKQDWNWQPKFDLENVSKEMFQNLIQKV